MKLSTDLAPCNESHPGYDITDAEWEFMKAIEAYQRRYRRRYPTWREVLHVARCLGYRRIARPTTIEKLPVEEESTTMASSEMKDESTTPSLS